MYMRVWDMLKISSDPNETRPLILCEYVNFFTFPFLLLFEHSLLVYHYSQCLKMSQMLFIFWHFSPLGPSTNRVQHVKFNLYREVANNPKKKRVCSFCSTPLSGSLALIPCKSLLLYHCSQILKLLEFGPNVF